MKKCSKCGEVKPLEAFSFDRRASDGRQARCKVCKNADARARNAKDPIPNRERANAWRLEHQDRRRLQAREYQRRLRSDPIRWQAYLERNRKNLAEQYRIQARRAIERLTDNYVRGLLVQGIDDADRSSIPPAAIEAKRLQLAIHRLAKEKLK